MIAGNSTFFYKRDRDIDHVCPHTIVYDLEVPYANYEYRFLLKNYYASEGAKIDFGDGVISSNLKTDLANEPLTATIFSHSYPSAGTYRISFDINDAAALGDARSAAGTPWSMFSLYCPSAGTTFVINQNWFKDHDTSIAKTHLINLEENRMTESVKVIDFNVNEIQSSLYFWPIFAGMDDARMTNRQLQRISTTKYKYNYNSLTCPVRHLTMSEAAPGGLSRAVNDRYMLLNARCKFGRLRKITANGINYNAFANADVADSLSSYTTRLENLSYYGSDNALIRVSYAASDIKHASVHPVSSDSSFYQQAMVRPIALGDIMFNNCISLSSVELDPDIKGICAYDFQNCYSLKSIDLTNITNLKGNQTFMNCTSLTEVRIPNLQKHGSTNGAQFKGCVNLTGAYITGNFYLFTDEFNGCSSLVDFPMSSITIPDKKVNPRCFSGCSSLSSINLPDNTMYISTEAFRDSGITGFVFPSAFTGLSKTDSLGVFNGCSNLHHIELPSSVTIIPENTFNASGLRDIHIPSSVSEIGPLAFAQSSLSSITFDEGVGLIGEKCFYRCWNLISADFPSSLTAIGPNCFNDARGIKLLKFNSLFIPNPTTFNDMWTLRDPVVSLPWHEGDVAGYPWGATVSGANHVVTFVYRNEVSPEVADQDEEPEEELLKFHLPLTSDFTELVNGYTPIWTNSSTSSDCSFTTFADHACLNAPGSPGQVNNKTKFGLQYKNLNNIVLTSDISISMWFNPKAAGNTTWYTYIRFGNKKNNQALNLGGRVQNWIYGGNESMDIGHTYGDTTQIPAADQIGHWFHHVVTYSRSTQTVSVYRDLYLVGTQGGVNLQLTMGSDHLRIGYTNRQCDARYVHGIRIYNKCLTLNNLSWLYNNKC